MKAELPAPGMIIEELADKVALHIDRLAPVAFNAAFDELIRYHRFLLGVHASRTPDGKPFNYADVAGEAWRAPHSEWIGQYRGIFERAANRIGDAPDFFEKLAHAPLYLLPRRGGPQLSDSILCSILDLNTILIHQLEAWVTKRTVAETAPGDSASPRLRLAGSDEKSYANLLPNVVGAWESVLLAAPTLYHWREERDGPDSDRWDALRASWPFLWRHLRNTAYMLAVAVWNEDETGAALLRDALVRWPRTLSHALTERAYLLQRRLLFPDITSLDLAGMQERIRPLLPQHMPVPTPDELFSAILHGAHNDTVFLTAALLLLWSMEGKQTSEIGAKTAAELLRREPAEPEDDRRGPPQSRPFGPLMMDIVRLEIAGDRRPKGTYGANIDHLVESLDNMTERRVVPGRIFRPSTLHARDGLHSAFLAILLARVPDTDNTLLTRIKDLAKNDAALPAGDRSLRDLLHALNRFTKAVETPSPALQRGLAFLQPGTELDLPAQKLKSIMTAMIAAVEEERITRLRSMPISERAIGELRDAVETSMLTPPGGVTFFRGFSVAKAPAHLEAEIFTSRFTGLSKAQFVDPPMEWESAGFAKQFAERVADQADGRIWNLFTRLRRELVTVAARIEVPAFWERITALAADVGAEPMLIVSRQAEGRALRQFVYQLREPPGGLTIERKNRQDMGDAYIATVEGVDVHGADFPAGTAWLFSPYILQAVQYAQLNTRGNVVTVTFEPAEDLTGVLVAEFRQKVLWADWPIYDIRCEDPEATND